MKRTPLPRRAVLIFALVAILCTALVHTRRSDSQQPGSSHDTFIQTTTEEHVAAEPWWPTRATAPLSAYTGSAACARCHAEESSGSPTAMQRAAAPAASSPFLIRGLRAKAAMGAYTYSLSGAEFTVTHGAESSSTPIAWDLGAGDLAHTFLYQRESHWYQSQVTFYTHSAALDTTTGFNTLGDADIHTALGQKLSTSEARKCFGCHTVHSTSSSGFDPARAEPGLGCEACHGPGRRHAEESSAAPPASIAPSSPFRRAIFNPAGLSPTGAIDFCGSCHRTTVDATLAAGPGSLGTAAVRFQPYRLEQSKCWRATQSERLTCTACHNPHQPLEKAAATYDKTCVGCHSVIHGNPAPRHVAQVSAANPARMSVQGSCVSCHMPKVEVTGMHGGFTDHRIRVAHQGDNFPE